MMIDPLSQLQAHPDSPHPRGTGVTVEPMRRRHLRSVVRIEEVTNPHPWSRRLFVSELTYPAGRIYLVARIGRSIVGYGGLMIMAGDGHITNLGVDPTHRRKGIASRLLVEAFRRALADGATALTLEVRASNRGAQELYRRFGFAPVGTRKGYYTDNGEDALIMWATEVEGVGYRDRLRAIEDEILNRPHDKRAQTEG